MKLYTEEQVRKAIELAQECRHEYGGVYFDYTETEIIEQLKPIEMPSDDEVDEAAKKILDSHKNMYAERLYFGLGAKWIRNKIQGGKQ